MGFSIDVQVSARANIDVLDLYFPRTRAWVAPWGCSQQSPKFRESVVLHPSKQGLFSVFPVFCKTKKIREKFSPRRVAILTRFSCENRRELQVFSWARDQILDARATISS